MTGLDKDVPYPLGKQQQKINQYDVQFENKTENKIAC
jgi:hypothetical protein